MNQGKLAVVCCATQAYTTAMIAQARRVISNLHDFAPKEEWRNRVLFVLVGDKSKECRDIINYYVAAGVSARLVSLEGEHSEKKHKDEGEGMEENACLKIGQMRTLAHDTARCFDADFCWSLDSDVLPPENALHCSLTMLEFDRGYYSVSTCPYPSQGGGGFLGGRGTPQQPILPDFYDDEKQIGDELKKRIEEHEAVKPAGDGSHTPEWIKEHQSIGEELKKLPPKGNVYAMNAQKWRRRGWLDNAYPATGRGAVLPSDWCGFGCTLMNRRALALATFEGYDGKGTEDLYVIWKRWYPAGLRINVITHCLCDHVIADRHSPTPKWVLQRGYHEVGGECDGHIRIESRPWYAARDGEKFNPLQDGKLTNPPKPVESPKASEAPEPAESVSKDTPVSEPN